MSNIKTNQAVMQATAIACLYFMKQYVSHTDRNSLVSKQLSWLCTAMSEIEETSTVTHASCYVSDDGSLLFSLELAPKAAKEIQSASCAIEGWMLVHTPYRFLMHYSPLSKAGKNNDQ